MASPQFEKLVNIIRANKRPPGDHPVEKLRAGMEKTSLPPADDVTATGVDAGGVPAEWVETPGADAGRVVLYLHGGGYVMGSLVTHRKLAATCRGAAGPGGRCSTPPSPPSPPRRVRPTTPCRPTGGCCNRAWRRAASPSPATRPAAASPSPRS